MNKFVNIGPIGFGKIMIILNDCIAKDSGAEMLCVNMMKKPFIDNEIDIDNNNPHDHRKIKNDIKKMTKLLIDLWKIKSQLNNIHSIECNGITNMIKIFYKDLKYELTDYTGKKYNEGMTDIKVLDVVNKELKEYDTLIISETLKPAIYFKENLVERSEVFLKKIGGKNE